MVKFIKSIIREVKTISFPKAKVLKKNLKIVIGFLVTFVLMVSLFDTTFATVMKFLLKS